MRIQSMKSHCGRHVGGLLVILLLITAGPAQASDEISAPVLQPTALAGPDTTVLVGEPVEFFGYASSPDDEIVLYAWDSGSRPE